MYQRTRKKLVDAGGGVAPSTHFPKQKGCTTTIFLRNYATEGKTGAGISKKTSVSGQVCAAERGFDAYSGDNIPTACKTYKGIAAREAELLGPVGNQGLVSAKSWV